MGSTQLPMCPHHLWEGPQTEGHTSCRWSDSRWRRGISRTPGVPAIPGTAPTCVPLRNDSPRPTYSGAQPVTPSKVSRVIDFQTGTFVKLGPIDPQALAAELQPLLIPGEQVHLAFKGIRDSLVFTDKRLISINVQG